MLSMLSKTLVATLAFRTVNALPTSSSSSAAGPVPTDNSALIAKLKTDANAVERFQDLLTSNGQPLEGNALTAATIFDFTQNEDSTVPGTQGGSINNAGPLNFPILTDSGLSLVFLTIGPCGIFASHVHPRANEFFFVVEGQIDFGYLLETGVFGGLGSPNPAINGTLNQYEGTLFPLGSVHRQINNYCEPATTFESFSSDDAGAVLVLNKITDGDRVIPRLIDPKDIDGLHPILPPEIVDTVDACLARCNIA